MAEYEATFSWPYPASSVILTGDFDNWQRSIRLSKTGTGFTGTVKVPYATTVHYKFIVDGNWACRDDLPKEATNSGYINNVIKTPSKADATNATHTYAPVADAVAHVNGIAPSAAEVAAEVSPAKETKPQTSAPITTTAVDAATTAATKAQEAAVGAAAGLAGVAGAAATFVNGDKAKSVGGEPKAAEPTAPIHPIKALADATAPPAIFAAVQGVIAPSSSAPKTLPDPADLHGQPMKDLADATAPPSIITAPVATVKDFANAAHQFVNGLNGTTTPGATPITEVPSSVVPTTLTDFAKAIPVATVPTVKDAAIAPTKTEQPPASTDPADPKDPIALVPAVALTDVPDLTPTVAATAPAESALDSVVSPSEEKAAEAATPGKTEVPAAVATKALELAAGATAAVGATVAAATAFGNGDKKFEAPATTAEPTTLGTVAGTVASNVGIALKSLTGVDPINANPILISQGTPAVATPAEGLAAPVAVQAGSKAAPAVGHVPEPTITAPVAVQAGTKETPAVKNVPQPTSTPTPAPAVIAAPAAPVTPTRETKELPPTSSPRPSTSSRTFPTFGSAHSTPSKNGSIRKKRGSFFGKVKEIFHHHKDGNSPKKGKD